jgi:hypothetical protein
MDAELGTLTKRTGSLNFAAVRLDDAIGQREAEPGTLLAGGKKWPKDFWKRVGRDAFAVVFDADEGVIVFAGECDVDGAFPGDGLDSVEHQIQDDLLDERRIVGYRRKGRVRRKKNSYRARPNLLPGEHDGLLDCDV